MASNSRITGSSSGFIKARSEHGQRSWNHTRTSSLTSRPTAHPSPSFTSTFSRRSHRLPSELWLEIFSNLSSSSDISSITLACTSFCTLAQPLLFTTLDVCPFFLGYNGSGPILRSNAYLKRTKERIALYTSSAKIRSNVQTVWVSPYSRSASNSGGAGASAENGRRDYLDPALVVAEVVNALHLFPNLRSVSWHAVEMKWEWWNVISSLQLSSLWINASSFPAIPPPPSPSASPVPLPVSLPSDQEDEKLSSSDATFPQSLSISHLYLDHWAYNGALTNHVSIAESHFPGVQLDILTLTVLPATIETISSPRPSTARWVVELLLQYGHQGVKFEKLTQLSLPYAVFGTSGSNSAGTVDDLFKALENCPNLEHLQILEPPSVGRSRPVVLPSLPKGMLPNLRTFEGPYAFAPVFLDGERPVKKLTIWGLDGPGAVCDSGKLESVLRELADQDYGVESIKANVSGIRRELMEVLAEFRDMKFLSLSSSSGEAFNAGMSEGFANFGVGAGRTSVFALYDLLRNVHLAPQLESLKISTRLDTNHSSGLDTETQQMEALYLIESLKAENPRLESVEIAFGSYWVGNYCLRWNKRASVQLNENSRRRHSTLIWEGSMGEAGTKEIIEVDVDDIAEGIGRRRREEQGRTGLIGWLSRMVSYLL